MPVHGDFFYDFLWNEEKKGKDMSSYERFLNNFIILRLWSSYSLKFKMSFASINKWNKQKKVFTVLLNALTLYHPWLIQF